MAHTLMSSPRADGFHMPAEFASHAGCWMLFPYRNDTWRENSQPAQQAFVAVAETIAQFEPVTMGVLAEHYQTARQMLSGKNRVVELSYNDAWVRDNGATFVRSSAREVRGVDWKFNAWGGDIYPNWSLDEQVAQKMLEIEGVDRYAADFILEGGSIHVDGAGTLLTTKECLLNSNRNPHLSQTDIETHLQNYLNVEKIIWLERGVFNDETNGHVDNFVCFAREGVVALTWTDDKNDPQYERSAEAYEFLMTATDARGRALEVHKIHQPNPMTITETEGAGVVVIEGAQSRAEGERLAASYINFYIANGGVIVPQFDDPHDKLALQKLSELFPDRKVVGVAGREILLGGGNVHCITQQVPA